ncbi:Bromodomain containing protein [Tritrichomonas foetus]|uniref:Bromodomain containing protein n=1 Tax=Tritrichomonas foetus TaxID=1144522 RepID=A0A1J4KQF2_9EUKA|nr:Bromodomain containing protein [Tritrichomonas foetus]|eukprot:OHT12020.1 Bromodomain containing protein [Tritrichomonas foetus]
MNDFQKTKCLKIVEKLIKNPICSPFVNMVDPVRDGAPDYFDFISEPMALKEVERNLKNNEYKDIEAFKRHIDLIWKNAITYNGEDTLFAHMAKEASLWFNKKMENFPENGLQEWFHKVQKITQDIFDALCHPPTELDPNNKLTREKNSDPDTKDNNYQNSDL